MKLFVESRTHNISLEWGKKHEIAIARDGRTLPGPHWGELGHECMHCERFYPKRFNQRDEPESFSGESLISGLFKSIGQ